MKTNIKQLVHKVTASITTVRGAVIAIAVVGVGLLGANALAYGPSRPTFTGEKPADYVTFNSITNNPNHGDERNFVLIREAGKGTYGDTIKLQPGKEYEVYSYYHNNAKSSLNASGKGIAENVRMAAQVPSVVKKGERGIVSTTITADNANPKKVWDEAYVTTDSTVALSYVPNSARIHNNGKTNGNGIASSLFSTTGTFLGYNELNGLLPGCNEYAGYVIYKLKVDQPNFTFKKEVSVAGEHKWVKSLKAKMGDTIDYKLTYKNTGTTRQNDITIMDQLPKGMSYVKGSTKVANLNAPNGLKVGDNLTTEGINAGSYGPNTTATVTFSAKIDDKDALACGEVTLLNKAVVSTKNGSKTDDATVTVDTPCKPTECKPGIPEGDKRCEAEKCTIEGLEDEDKDSENCVAPVTELPTTGVEQIVGTIIGLVLLTAGVVYYLRSRHALAHSIATGAIAHSEQKLLTERTETDPKDDKKSL